MSLKIVRLGQNGPQRPRAPKLSELEGEPVADQTDSDGNLPADDETTAITQQPQRPASQTGSQLAQSSAQSAQQSAQSDPDMPSVTGPLGAGHTAKLLMELFVGERSGKLVVDTTSGLKGLIYFFAGEPVHVHIQDGGAALEKRVAAKSPLKPPLAAPLHSKSRSPIGALSRRTSPVAVLEALREEVRDTCRTLLAATAGAFAFFDGETHLDSAPLTAVNTFGLVLEARRRAMDPAGLLRLGEQLASQYPVPRGGFANATLRIRAFTGGFDLADVVDGTHSGNEIFQAAHLDPMIGAIVLGTLVDTGLVQLFGSPRASSAKDTRSTANRAALAAADSKQLSQLSAGPAKGGADLLAFYCELKPEPDPDVVLGIEGSAGPAQVERCYQQRLAELDPRAIPPGANQAYLLARVEELREKVERAYLTKMGASSTGPKKKAAAAYEIFDRIGTGGMAEVFLGRARDNPDQLVAIKCILPELRADASFSQMFLEEARLARRIQHPNVVRIFTVGKSTDDLYLAMEFVDGLDFGDLVKRGREQEKKVTVDIACRVIASACAGLHAAHNARDRLGNATPILHRDVSPQNILVSRMGDVKLSDFGIAKATDSLEEDSRTVKGKIPFLAPELLKGKPASVASDVYAMAMTFYAVLGKLPFARGDTHATMYAILHDTLPPLSSYAPEVPRYIDALLARAAAKEPADRHISAEELQLDLEEYLATRPPVDVGAWARPLAGKRADRSGRPITSTTSKPITSSAGRPITSTTSSRPITSTTSKPITSTTSRPITSTTTKAPASQSGKSLSAITQSVPSPVAFSGEGSGRNPVAPRPGVSLSGEGSGRNPVAPRPLPQVPARVIGGGDDDVDVDIDDF